MASPRTGKCPEPTVMGWILQAQCSNHDSVPDVLCDPEQINYLLCAFIFPIVNQSMPCLTCVPAGRSVPAHFKKAKAKLHSSEALLEILQRQITREKHISLCPGQRGQVGFILVPLYSESSVRKTRSPTVWDKENAYLQLFTEFYLNNHNSTIIGKLHWKVLYKKGVFSN